MMQAWMTILGIADAALHDEVSKTLNKCAGGFFQSDVDCRQAGRDPVQFRALWSKDLLTCQTAEQQPSAGE